MNFKNKIFITFFVLLAFILFFNINNVFASSNYVLPEDKFLSTLYELEDYFNDEYYYFSLRNGGAYDIYFINKNQYPNLKAYISEYNSNGGNYNTVAFNTSNGTVNAIKYFFLGKKDGVPHFYDKGSSSIGNSYCEKNGNGSQFVYTNLDIYTDNTYTSLFFQAPVTEEIPEGITIPALETAEQIPQAIVTTLKILIPVGLIVLSIGLVVYLIKRVRYSIM